MQLNLLLVHNFHPYLNLFINKELEMIKIFCSLFREYIGYFLLFFSLSFDDNRVDKTKVHTTQVQKRKERW